MHRCIFELIINLPDLSELDISKIDIYVKRELLLDKEIKVNYSCYPVVIDGVDHVAFEVSARGLRDYRSAKWVLTEAIELMEESRDGYRQQQ